MGGVLGVRARTVSAPEAPTKVADFLLNRSWPARLLKGMAGSVASAVTLPRDVLAGQVDLTSDEAAGRVADLAGLATPMGALARTAPRTAANTMASRTARMYDPPVKPSRPFEADYPAGAPADDAGRLTHDVDGRPLVARHVVGRKVVGGEDEALPPAQYDALAEATTGQESARVAAREIGRGIVGRVSIDRRSGRPDAIILDSGLKPDQAEKVLAHELGHAVDVLAGQIPTKGLSDELKAVYNDLNNPSRGGGKPFTPAAHGYKAAETPREFIAEAIRAYMADPNYLKTVAPRT